MNQPMGSLSVKKRLYIDDVGRLMRARADQVTRWMLCAVSDHCAVARTRIRINRVKSRLEVSIPIMASLSLSIYYVIIFAIFFSIL